MTITSIYHVTVPFMNDPGELRDPHTGVAPPFADETWQRIKATLGGSYHALDFEEGKEGAWVVQAEFLDPGKAAACDAELSAIAESYQARCLEWEAQLKVAPKRQYQMELIGYFSGIANVEASTLAEAEMATAALLSSEVAWAALPYSQGYVCCRQSGYAAKEGPL